MKIAIVHYSSAPVVGGVERVIEEHERLLLRHGHEVAVFCKRGGGNAQVFSDSDELVGKLPGYDVVFVHNVLTMPFDVPFTEALWRATERCRMVAWTHDVAAANPDLAPIPELFRRVPRGVEFVAVSELRRRELRDYLGVADCRVIPNGVEPARVLGLPESVARLAGRCEGKMIFLHPTRLLRRKNVECGIEIVKALGDAVLVVTGAEDPHNPASRDYARMLRSIAGPETVFASDEMAVSDAELSALYRLADVLVFPSRQEGFGLPLLEARLNRLPIVFSAREPMIGLAGEDAFPISLSETPAEIAARLRPWLAANRVIQNRRAVMSEFSWSGIYQKHIVPLLDGARDSLDK